MGESTVARKKAREQLQNKYIQWELHLQKYGREHSCEKEGEGTIAKERY
jgi:hypothetical protein